MDLALPTPAAPASSAGTPAATATTAAPTAAAAPAPAPPAAGRLEALVSPPSGAGLGARGLGDSPVPLGPAAAGALLLVLACVAIWATRRRRRAARLVEVVESISLGPKRALVVARMGDELLVLGTSEAGVNLLSTRPVPASAATGAAAAPPARPTLLDAHALVQGVRGRLSRSRQPAAQAGFEALLAESVEDAELRRKLAAGHVGSVS